MQQMTNDQIKELNKIKKLIKEGKRRFELRTDRNYIDDLNNLDIKPHDAWQHILSLNKNLYFIDTRYDLKKDNKALTFKKNINKKIAYIKIKIEYNNNEEVVCLSFHEDGK